jgi:hypothetical protein
MVTKASTPAKPAAKLQAGDGDSMRRAFLLLVLLGLVILGAGILILGAFPPEPHTQPVQKILPNDRFQQH